MKLPPFGVEAESNDDRATHRSLRGSVVGTVDLGDGIRLGVGDLLAGLVGAAEEHERETPHDDEAGHDPDEPRVERTTGVSRRGSAEARRVLGRFAEVEIVLHAPSIGPSRPDVRSEAWAYHPCVSEIGDVLAAIESLSARGERMALATIVAVRGSTYRRPGARLLVPEEGAPVGNISGGCLEGDVADMARVVMDEGRARLAGWDLTADDDAVWGLGLGCNGAIEVFIEPAESAAEVAGALRTALDEERPISVVTVGRGPETASRAHGSS